MKTAAILVLVLIVGSCERTAEAPDPGSPPASYSVPLARLDAAYDCRDGDPSGDGRAQPVLLVHGTGVTRAQNWGWGYWPGLAAAGFEVCWVTLPATGLRDIQVAAEYVARAAEAVAASSGEQVDIIGHSQGGLVARWAVKYFAAGRTVDDLVGLAAPNHGTLTADRAADRDRCFASCQQMRPGSNFLTALNHPDETPADISYTNIFTVRDEFIIPASSSELIGAANHAVQDICPGRPVEHLLLAGDAVTWELTVDALTHPGGADPDRISPFACVKLALPGATLDWPEREADTTNASFVSSEPDLRGYAR
jgi:triacylglycerol lipase